MRTMPKWLRKTLLVAITIATFGMVTPQALLADPSSEDKQPKRDIYETIPSSETKTLIHSDEDIYESERDRFISYMSKEAKEQSYLKFGTRIGPVIEDEFNEVILPNIESVISDITALYPEEDLSNLTISSTPSGKTSEKIFHIMDNKTNKDIIRFHVRRDNRPQEPYAFNFHYHTVHDQFQKHHELGIIYWDKNTPPHWMT